MTYFGRLKGLSKQGATTWSLDYLECVGLADKAKVRLDELSGGQQQKVQLGVTIVHEAELLSLDEATKGFDPVNRRLLMDIIEDQTKACVVMVLVFAGCAPELHNEGRPWFSTPIEWGNGFRVGAARDAKVVNVPTRVRLGDQGNAQRTAINRCHPSPLGTESQTSPSKIELYSVWPSIGMAVKHND